MLKTNKDKIKCDSTCVCNSPKLDDILIHLCTISDTNISYAEHILDTFLRRCTKPDKANFGNIENGDLLIKGYALIGYVRDIMHGKGKRNLAYTYIWVWFQYFPFLAKQALFSFVHIRDITRDIWIRPYGSWKDIKLFAEYVYKRTNNKNHELIQYCVTLFVNEIRKISQNEQKNEQKNRQNHQIHKYYSFLALKWCPRERTRSKWLFQHIALAYHLKEKPHTVNVSKSLQFRHFRKTVNRLSKNIINVEKSLSTDSLDKLEIFNMSISTRLKYFWSLYNHSNPVYRKPYPNNQLKCNIDKMTEHTKRTQYTFSLELLVRRVVETTRIKKFKLYSLPRLILQKCWKSLHTPHKLSMSLPIVDVSRSMDGVLYKAIATGIYLSENATGPFQNKLVLYSGKISVVDLSSCKDLCEKINLILDTHRGDYNDFVKLVDTLEWVLDDIVFAYPDSIDYVRQLTLILISDQFHQNNIDYLQSMKYNPFLVLYKLSNIENCTGTIELQQYSNKSGLFYFEDDNINTVIRCIANRNKPNIKPHTKQPKQATYPKQEPNTKRNYLSLLNSSRYKYLVHDIMIFLLTVDDLNCSFTTT